MRDHALIASSDPPPRPAPHPADARLILGVRGVRGFVDGLLTVVLPAYLGLLGFSSTRIGLVSTATLVGSAALTLTVALAGRRWSHRTVLSGAALLMIGTGMGFALFTSFAALLVVGFLGTLNPTSGDVSVFLPTEQAVLPGTVAPGGRTARFARYALIGALAGAFGSLAAGVPVAAARRFGWTELSGLRST